MERFNHFSEKIFWRSEFWDLLGGCWIFDEDQKSWQWPDLVKILKNAYMVYGQANSHKNSWTVSSMGGTVANLDPLSLSILFFCSVSKCYSAEAVWVPVRLLSSLKCDLHFDSLSLLARHARHYTLAITKKINDKNGLGFRS